MKRRTLLASVLVAASATGGLSYAQNNDSPATTSATSIPGPTVGALSGDATRALNAFGVFAEPQDPGVTASATQRAEQSLGNDRLDPSRSRLAYKDSSFTVYVFANDKTLCYAGFQSAEIGAMGCVRTQAEINSLAAGTYVPHITKLDDGYRVWALLPDGTTGVTLTAEGERPRGLQLHGNVATTTAAKPESLSWKTPTGETQTHTFDAMYANVYP